MSKAIQAKKKSIITKHQVHKTDTGSVETQVALLTHEISNLTEHLKRNPKDFSSRRGLLRKVGERRSLLRYISSLSPARYKKILSVNSLKAL